MRNKGQTSHLSTTNEIKLREIKLRGKPSLLCKCWNISLGRYMQTAQIPLPEVLSLWSSGLTIEQIAERVDCSTATVNRRLAEARRIGIQEATRPPANKLRKRRAALKAQILRTVGLSAIEISKTIGCCRRSAYNYLESA